MGKKRLHRGPERRQGWYMTSDGWRERLGEEIERQGLSMKAVSQKARLGETYVRDALARGRGKEENLRKIAAALDISYEWLLHGIGERHARRPGQGEMAWFIPILGEVAAGLWLDRKHFDTPLEKRPASPFPPDPRYPIKSQFDLVVRGESLNRFARDGDLCAASAATRPASSRTTATLSSSSAPGTARTWRRRRSASSAVAVSPSCAGIGRSALAGSD